MSFATTFRSSSASVSWWNSPDSPRSPEQGRSSFNIGFRGCWLADHGWLLQPSYAWAPGSRWQIRLLRSPELALRQSLPLRSEGPALVLAPALQKRVVSGRLPQVRDRIIESADYSMGVGSHFDTLFSGLRTYTLGGHHR